MKISYGSNFDFFKLLKYVYSAARTKGEMASFLGLDRAFLKKLLKKYDVANYFSNIEE